LSAIIKKLRIVRNIPILAFFSGQLAPTTPQQRELMEKFKVGIAEALGVPPEAIREDIVERWFIGFARAFVKPEYWEKLGI